ncbi:hypothetical protein FNF31_08009 [Cafeteria roenbergensis]|uniref:Translocon Sec61/SecY plug domain-containing protein n=1 Tax=Cafeteria roenbergensis TaxID=33653 RepID=A0A5A8BYG9_CAFRO|nr:hypothetical protein FNF31_08009 [Cafeteria roenbergensis]
MAFHTQGSADPLYWLRMIMASNRGTLMELASRPSSCGDAFSPTTINVGRGTEFHGAIISLFPQPLSAGRSPSSSKNNNPAYAPRDFDIKLFYTSNMPIILQTALVSQVYFFSQALFYLFFILIMCGLFSYMWIWISAQDPTRVFQREDEAGFRLATRGRYANLKDALRSTIPTAAMVGGMVIGALSVFSDVMGARGSGTGILLAVTIIYQYFETFTREGKEGRLADILGGFTNTKSM